MEESKMREHADAHVRAMVDGDLRRAASDLTPEARAEAAAVMKEVPNPIHGAQIQELSADGATGVALILYAGGDKEVVVESRWAERDGRPMIVGLSVV